MFTFNISRNIININRISSMNVDLLMTFILKLEGMNSI